MNEKLNEKNDEVEEKSLLNKGTLKQAHIMSKKELGLLSEKEWDSSKPKYVRFDDNMKVYITTHSDGPD